MVCIYYFYCCEILHTSFEQKSEGLRSIHSHVDMRIYFENFMESARVLCLHTSCVVSKRSNKWAKRTSEISDTKQRACNTPYNLFHVVFCLLFTYWGTAHTSRNMIHDDTWFLIGGITFLAWNKRYAPFGWFSSVCERKFTLQPFMVSKISVHNKIKYSPSHTGRVLTRDIGVIMHSWVTHF